MKEYNIEEGNRLIAEFAGYILYDDPIGGLGHNKKYWFTKEDVVLINTDTNKEIWDFRLCEEFELQYHLSWDWLMPVVEKIENTTINDYKFQALIGFGTYSAIACSNNGLGNVMRWESSYVVTESDKIYTKKASSKRIGLWTAIIKFIEWYNSLKNDK